MDISAWVETFSFRLDMDSIIIIRASTQIVSLPKKFDRQPY